jgi:hypothetical protein
VLESELKAGLSQSLAEMDLIGLVEGFVGAVQTNETVKRRKYQDKLLDHLNEVDSLGSSSDDLLAALEAAIDRLLQQVSSDCMEESTRKEAQTLALAIAQSCFLCICRMHPTWMQRDFRWMHTLAHVCSMLSSAALGCEDQLQWMNITAVLFGPCLQAVRLQLASTHSGFAVSTFQATFPTITLCLASHVANGVNVGIEASKALPGLVENLASLYTLDQSVDSKESISESLLQLCKSVSDCALPDAASTSHRQLIESLLRWLSSNTALGSNIISKHAVPLCLKLVDIHMVHGQWREADEIMQVLTDDIEQDTPAAGSADLRIDIDQVSKQSEDACQILQQAFVLALKTDKGQEHVVQVSTRLLQHACRLSQGQDKAVFLDVVAHLCEDIKTKRRGEQVWNMRYLLTTAHKYLKYFPNAPRVKSLQV